MQIVQLLRRALKRERRRYTRFTSPSLTLVSGPKRYTTLDWSMSGCRIAGRNGALQQERLDGSMFIEGKETHGEFTAEVMRRTDTGELGLRWVTLSGSITATMAECRPW
jgi:hypothetical protein